MDYKKLVQSLLDSYQNDFPLVERPYLAMAEELGVSEEDVIETLNRMKSENILSRVGAIYKTHSVGYSLLAACKVGPENLEQVSAFINQFNEVNHNYERENDVNLWFVVTASSKDKVEAVCQAIELNCHVTVLRLPMIKPYKIDLSVKEKIDWGAL